MSHFCRSFLDVNNDLNGTCEVVTSDFKLNLSSLHSACDVNPQCYLLKGKLDISDLSYCLLC